MLIECKNRPIFSVEEGNVKNENIKSSNCTITEQMALLKLMRPKKNKLRKGNENDN